VFFPPEWKTKHPQKEKILTMKFFIWNKKTNTPGIHIFLSFIGFRKNDLPFWIHKDNIIF